MRRALPLLLLAAHLTLVALAAHLPDSLAAAVGASVYAPLALARAAGLPVFAPAPSGGWAAPSALGWVLVALAWFVAWWTLCAGVRALRRRVAASGG